MLGTSLPRSSIAPAKIMAVAETNVNPNAASAGRKKGSVGFAIRRWN